MRRACRWASYGIAGVLLAAILLVCALPLVDWNFARPWINRQLSQTLGRGFEIRGDLGLSWRRQTNFTGSGGWGVPVLHLVAHDLRLQNPDWARQPQFASLAVLEFDLVPWPLLAHRIEIPTLRLEQPVLDLERDAANRANWDFSLAHSDRPSAWVLQLGQIEFPAGRIGYSDERQHTRLQIDIDTLGQAIPFTDALAEVHADAVRNASGAVAPGLPTAAVVGAASQPMPPVQPYALALTVRGTYQGTPLEAHAKAGSVLSINDTRRPFPLQVELRSGTTHIALTGTLVDPAHLAALDVRLDLSGASMANLYGLTGVNLPATPPYATDGRLVGSLKPGALALHYENFNGRVGGSDLHGSLLYQQAQPRPRLSGALQSNLLQFADLAPLIGADSNASKASRGDSFRQPAGRALPAEPFSTDRWRALDVDVTLVGKKIVRSADLPIDNLSTHLIIDAGVLSLVPLRFGVAGGTLDSTIRLDGSVTPLRAQLKLAVRQLKLKQLFPSLTTPQSSFGEMNGDTALSATGNSIAALAADANGELKLVVTDGTVSGTLLEEAGLNVGNVVLDKLFGNQDVKINCAASDFVATDGMLDTRFFALDTEDALITTSGTINLKSEQMDLTVRPQTKGVRILSLRSPLYVKGTFKQPDVGVDKLALALRGAAALGLGLLAPPAAILPLLSPSHKQNLPCAKIVEQMHAVPIAPPPGRRQAPKAALDLTPPASGAAAPGK